MKSKKTIQLLLLFSFSISISSFENCSSTSCSPTGPQIRFPFRLLDRQPSTCGFPGFDLTCNNKNETLLHLHPSQSFIVNHISYVTQVVTIQPNLCFLERINDINLNGTPFDAIVMESYTFFNCSSSMKAVMPMMISFSCLGSVNHSVYAVETSWISQGYVLDECSVMKTVNVPVSRNDDVTNELTFYWFFPYCKTCESRGGTCGMKSRFQETVCYGGSSSSHGLSRGIKYGLSLGIGALFIGLLFFVFSKVNNHSRAYLQSINLLSITVTPHQPTTTGLDEPTIQSYPKIVLGESCTLAEDDGTCPICLSNYKPKESVRTIPECNHYFHSDCIDEWLKLNATCPVCRNSPDTLVPVTPCSTVSLHATTQS